MPWLAWASTLISNLPRAEDKKAEPLSRKNNSLSAFIPLINVAF